MRHPMRFPSELCHHGIPGMHWGVRRYQNYDGTLTPAGKERYKKILKEIDFDDTSDYYPQMWRNDKIQVRESGVRIGRKYDSIKKGSTFQRLADAGEPFDSKRKYVSILPGDNKTYIKAYKDLGIKNVDKALNYKFKATKDVKVAKGKEVADYVLNTFGNQTLKTSYDIRDQLWLTSAIDNKHLKMLSSSDDVKFMKNLKKMWNKADDAVNDFFHKSVFKNAKMSSNVLDHFAELGYDAIVDIEDVMFTDYPLILLNPEKSVELVSSTPIKKR